MIKFESKLGYHKGNKRLWLEGKRLLDHNFIKDKRYSISYDRNFVMIEFKEDGTHKINGTVKLPIIDICNRKLGYSFPNCERVEVEFDIDNLIIKGI
jgi:DNA (cytosine-5)-methyltransferase 1